MLKRVFVLLTLIFLLGCTKETDKEGKPVVYTSFYPVYDLVKQIAEDTVELRTFMPLDKDPHLWEPTPKDMKELTKADLLIVNGANLERWLDQVKENLPQLKILVLSDSVDLITYKGAAAIGDFQYMCQQKVLKDEVYKLDFGHTHEDIMRVAFIDNSQNLSREELIRKGKKIMEEKGALVAQKEHIQVEENKVYALEMGHESGEISYSFPKDGNWVFISDRISEKILPYTFVNQKNDVLEVETLLEGSTSGLDKITYDPHSWLSLINAKKYLNSIYDQFVELYPEHGKLYRKTKLKAVDALTDLEYEYKEKFKDITQREFVVTHYAYAYLARDFELIQFPLQGLISTESPSLNTIRKALDFCRHFGINTIFYENLSDKKSADTLAEELGGKSVALTSMEYMRPNTKENYTEIMRNNLHALYTSMKGR